MELTARNCALEALLNVVENEGYSNIVIDKAIKKYQLEPRDAGLCSHIFYGVLENRITLDYYIGKFLNRPDYTLNTAVREILRIAFYQFIYLDKIPENAIVNEAVKAVKEIKKQGQSGFVNALLREFLRNKDAISLPEIDSPYGLSINYSIPLELIGLWIRSYGYDNTIQIVKSLSEKPKHFIRLNNTKADDIELGFKYPFLENSYELGNVGNITELQEFKDGLFHVQDLSSQYLCEILSPKPNEKIIDVCSAPGGKTFTIAEKMNGEGTVYAYDLYKGRVKLIRDGAYRLGLKNVMASMRDATSEKCEISDADRILCDVPCSGFGTIRRKAEIRYKELKTLDELPEIQYDILVKSSKHLKSGGALVYSTCTLNPAENGEVADKFLRENKDFTAVTIKIPQGLKRTIE
ncbi:MAG: 16S rRNA (cytosine(967)-C(5))-methyltransferase RsmB, partial [Clostridia bacterium]